jgi:hypothetical protein
MKSIKNVVSSPKKDQNNLVNPPFLYCKIALIYYFIDEFPSQLTKRYK